MNLRSRVSVSPKSTNPEVLLRDTNDGTEIRAIRDYLNEKARELDQKYDFRYSVLISVFARLIAEGWLTLEDLAGLDIAKCRSSFVNTALLKDGRA